MKKLYLFLFYIVNLKSYAALIFSSKFSSTIIRPVLNDCDIAIILAKTQDLAIASEEYQQNLSLQIKFLHHYLHYSNLEHFFWGNTQIPAFKAQHQFLEDHNCCSRTFIGKNEEIFRSIYFHNKLRLPFFNLSQVCLEYMLNYLLIIQVFDIGNLKKEKIIFRQGYHDESISRGLKKVPLQNIPLFFAENKLLGSPFLTENFSPLSNNTKDILIVISQYGKKDFHQIKEFYNHVEKFIDDSKSENDIQITNVSFFNGFPIIYQPKIESNTPKIFFQHGK